MNKLKQYIKLLETITKKKVLLKEELHIEFKKEVIKTYWKFVRQATIDLIYKDLITNLKNHKEKIKVETFFINKIDEQNILGYFYEKNFYIKNNDVIIRNKKMKLINDINPICITVSLDQNKDMAGSTVEDNHIMIYPYSLFSRNQFIEMIFNNNKNEFNKAINWEFTTLYHELIHVIEINSNMKANSSIVRKYKNSNRKDYFLSTIEFEPQIYSTYSWLKRNVITVKEKLNYSTFFTVVPIKLEFLKTLKENDVKRYHIAMNQLFDLLKKNYLYDDQYKIPDWINQ